MAVEFEPIQSSYASGELDPQLASREDADLYYSGAERARNVLLIPHGGITRRPGLLYRATMVPVLDQVDLTGGGIVVTAPNGGTASNATDGDDTTKVTTTINIGTVDPYVILHVDLGVGAPTVRFADVRNISTNGAPFINIADEVRIQYSDDNTVWTDLENTFPFVTDEDSRWNYRRAFTTPEAHRYWRVVRIGTTDGGTRKFELGQFKLWADADPELLSAVRLVQFEASSDQTYLVVATDRNVRIFRDGIRQADVSIPHTTAQLAEASWTQSLDTLILFHNDVQPHTVRRLGQDDLWRDQVQEFTNIPTFDFGDQGEGAEPVWGNEAAGSGTIIRGWPRCGAFFRARLYMAGTRDLGQTYWASGAQGDLFDFNIGTGAADDSFSVTVDTDEAADIFFFEPSDFLFIITSSGPFYQGPRDDPPTPDNVTVSRVRGKKRARGPGFRTFQLDTGIIFLDDSGEQLNEITETVFRGRFEVNNLAFLAPHLIRDPQDITLRRSLSTDRGDLLLLPNSDGSLAVLHTLRNRDFSGWTGWHAGKAAADALQGRFIAVGTQVGGINGRFFAVVERLVNGRLQRTLEEFLDNSFLDSSVTTTAVAETLLAATDGQEVFTYTIGSPAKQGDTKTPELTDVGTDTETQTVTWESNQTSATIPNFNLTITEVSGASLLVALSLDHPTSNTVTGVTYGGQALTFVGNVVEAATFRSEMSLWRLDSPPRSGDIVATFDGVIENGLMTALVANNLDMASTVNIETTTATSTGSISLSITPSTTRALVLDFTCVGTAGTATPTGTGHLEVSDQSTGGTEAAQQIGEVLVEDGGTVTPGWTKDSGTYNRLTQLAVALPAARSSDISDLVVRLNDVILQNGVECFVDLAAKTVSLSSTVAAGVSAGDTLRVAIQIKTVTGLDHLEGETLRTRVDGAVGNDVTVVGGSVTLGNFSDDQVELGLDFPDVKEILVDELMTRNVDPLTEEEARFEVFAVSNGRGVGDGVLVRDMPVAVPPGSATGTVRGKRKRVHTAVVTISNTQGFFFGANDEPTEAVVLSELGDFLLDRRPPLRSQTLRIYNLQGWTLDGQTEISQRDPVPMTVLSVTRRMAISGVRT